MLEKVQSLFDGRLVDTLKVALPNGAVLAVVNLVSLNQLATFVSVSLTIAYTVWRWRRDSKKG